MLMMLGLPALAANSTNRLPVLFLPGDIFVSRDPDPVLQQVENLGDGTGSANDCFRPVSRYFDRIVHPSQLITSLPRALLALFTTFERLVLTLRSMIDAPPSRGGA